MQLLAQFRCHTERVRPSSKITGVVIVVLAAISFVIWTAAIQMDNRGFLSVTFMQIGKGDAVFIEAPSGRTMLIDGGPNASVLRSLSSVVPWWKRDIDVVVIAHADSVHMGGIVDILQRYKVGQVFVSGVMGSGPTWTTLQSVIAKAKESGTSVSLAKRGQIIDLGGGAFIQILFPDRDLSNAAASAGCIEMRLFYGKTSFMLSCGIPVIDEYLIRLDGAKLHSDVLYASGATSTPLLAGFVGASIAAKPSMRFVSDGTTVVSK